MFSLHHTPDHQPGLRSTARRSATARPIAIRRDTPSPAGATRPERRSQAARHAAQDLRSTLDDAAARPLDDRDGWVRLAASARRSIDELIALGHVPSSLRIAQDEPAVVVRRTVAAAWRHVARTVGDAPAGRE